MKSVKGCPESFDYKRFKTLLEKVKEEDIRWPYYNRVKHDVEDDVIAVHAPIIVLEGNYLLLDEAPWKELQTMCDDSIFITTNSICISKKYIHDSCNKCIFFASAMIVLPFGIRASSDSVSPFISKSRTK